MVEKTGTGRPPRKGWRLQTGTGTTTASYVTHDHSIKDFEKITICIKETGGAQSMYYKIEVSMQKVDWYELKGETSIAANGNVYQTLTDPWRWIRISEKNNSGAATYVYQIFGMRSV